MITFSLRQQKDLEKKNYRRPAHTGAGLLPVDRCQGFV